MATCTINSGASQQFRSLCQQWKKGGYPKIQNDLEKAFAAISQDILANRGARIQAGTELEVYKYRQNSSDVQRGARYGWRIIALLHKPTNTMYPIIVYPKKEWENVADSFLAETIKEIRQILGYCISPGCDGTMATAPVLQQEQQSSTSTGSTHNKMRCLKCGAVQWISS